MARPAARAAGGTGPEKIGTEGAGYGAVSNISNPRMRGLSPATSANGMAVILCGGGGYFRIQLWKESTPVARWLQNRGYTAFELIYRLPSDGWEPTAPFADAQRAMKIVRSRAAEFGLRPDRDRHPRLFRRRASRRVHRAPARTRKLYAGSDRYEAARARPDFAVLLFPVVSMRKPFDHHPHAQGDHRRQAGPARREDAWSLDSYAAKARRRSSCSRPPTIRPPRPVTTSRCSNR